MLKSDEANNINMEQLGDNVIHILLSSGHMSGIENYTVYSGHCARQPPPYYSHLVQAQGGKSPYIIHLFKLTTSLSQPLIFSPWVTILARFHCITIRA